MTSIKSAKSARTPLNRWHRANGAKMFDYAGWDMPAHYAGGILQEHLATRKFAGLFDICHMGRFRITGDGCIDFLQYVLSSNVEALGPSQAQYTLIPNESGGVIDDAYVYRFGPSEYLLAVNAANRGRDWTHLESHVTRFGDVRMEDHTEQVAMVALQGPFSKQILEELLEEGSMPDPAHNSLSKVTLCGAPVVVSRTGYTGEPVGFELFVPAEEAEQVWTALVKVGRPRGLLPAGLAARDTLRLEAGLPLYGHELGAGPEGEELPALAFPTSKVAVSFSPRKGDYIGRSALAEQFRHLQDLNAGVQESSKVLPRRIRPLAILDSGIARQGHEVFLGQKKIGVVTSGTIAPYWKFEGRGATMKITHQSDRRAIALAYVDTRVRVNQDVEVAVRNRRLRGRIVRWHGRSEAPPYFHPIPAEREPRQRPPAVGNGLEQAALILEKSIENHRWRQQRCINLIPSEMTPSPLVRLLQVTDPVGRYAEHKELLAAFGQDVFYYQGTDLIAWAEERLVEEMSSFLGCPLVEARTVSGQMANMTVFSGLVDFKNRTDRRRETERLRLVMNNHLGKGGHLSSQPMGALRDYIAKDPVTERYAVVNFPILQDDPYRIDVDRVAALLEQLEPELIIFGKSMVLYPEPVAEVRRLVESKKRRPTIMYDMAHVLGLVGPHFQQPFAEGADIVTGSTHKTFFGTQRGIIGANFASDSTEFGLWKAIRRRAFPGMVSNHHLGTLLGLLLAAVEMNTFKDDYQRQVIANAKAFARGLAEAGLHVEGDPAVQHTETHQVLVNVGYARGCEAAERLEANNIIVNYQALPHDESFTSSSGLRLGVAEMTRFGMKETDLEAFATLFADAVAGNDVGEKVSEFRDGFRTMQYCFEGDSLDPLKRQLLETF